MLKVSIPQDTKRLRQQITALEWQIEYDNCEKDREVHLQALEDLKQALK